MLYFLIFMSEGADNTRAAQVVARDAGESVQLILNL